MTQEEEQTVQHILTASSQRVDVVKRARAILAVRAGKPSTQAAPEAGYKSGDSVSGLVERFNERGLAALLIAPGRGRKEPSTPEQREPILEEFGQGPDREEDATATWARLTLRRARRKPALPKVGASTIGQVLQEAGYRSGKTRPGSPTAEAIRVRKAGTRMVRAPKAGENNG